MPRGTDAVERMRQHIAALRRDDDRDRYLRERFREDVRAIEAEAASPAASGDALRLLRDLVEEVGSEPITDNRARTMGAWIRARKYLTDQTFRDLQEPSDTADLPSPPPHRYRKGWTC